MKTNTDPVEQLLSPSWLSGLIAVSVGLVVTVGIILVFNFNNSQVQQQIIGWQSTNIVTPTLTLPGETASGGSTNSLQNTWPLLGFWMAVGLIVYFIIESIGHGLKNASEIKKELNYVHIRRGALLRDNFEVVALRLVSAIAWVIFINFFFKRIIPYAITAAHASASDLKNLNSLLDAVLAFAILALSMHAHTIFVRLATGRTRLFNIR